MKHEATKAFLFSAFSRSEPNYTILKFVFLYVSLVVI